MKISLVGLYTLVQLLLYNNIICNCHINGVSASYLFILGIFMVNLACRDESLKEEMLRRIQSFFPSCAIVDLKEDTNSIVYACKRGASDPVLNLERLEQTFASLDKMIHSVWEHTNVDLKEFMEEIKFLD